MTIIRKLLEKWEEYEKRLELSETVSYNENDEEEVIISHDEYKRVMATLDTWLKSNPQFRKQKYLNKGIQSTDTDAYVYIFKKVGGIKKYIVIHRKKIS